MDRRRAVALLEERLSELEQLPARRDRSFSEWYERTVATLRNALPDGHRAHNGITTIRWSPAVYPTTDEARTRTFNGGRAQAAAILKAAIYELTELAEDAATDETSVAPVLAVHEVKLLERMLAEVRRGEEEGALDEVEPETRAEIAAEVDTLQTQLRSPKPKRSIVKAALASLRSITEQAVGSAIGTGVVVAIKMASDGIL